MTLPINRPVFAKLHSTYAAIYDIDNRMIIRSPDLHKQTDAFVKWCDDTSQIIDALNDIKPQNPTIELPTRVGFKYSSLKGADNRVIISFGVDRELTEDEYEQFEADIWEISQALNKDNDFNDLITDNGC